MIFLDPSGTRWKKTKLAAVLVGSSLSVPIFALLTVAFLASPGWSPFSIQQSVPKVQPKTVAEASVPAKDAKVISDNTGHTAVLSQSPSESQPTASTQEAVTPISEKQYTVALASVPASAVSQQPQQDTKTDTATQVTPQPAATPDPTPAPAQPTADPGNSSYGTAHKPTDPGSQGKGRPN